MSALQHAQTAEPAARVVALLDEYEHLVWRVGFNAQLQERSKMRGGSSRYLSALDGEAAELRTALNDAIWSLVATAGGER